MLNAAGLNTPDAIAPGEIVTGRGLGGASLEGAVGPSIEVRPVTQTPIVMASDLLGEFAQPLTLRSIAGVTLNLQVPASISALYPPRAWLLYFATGGAPAQQPTMSLKR